MLEGEKLRNKILDFLQRTFSFGKHRKIERVELKGKFIGKNMLPKVEEEQPRWLLIIRFDGF